MDDRDEPDTYVEALKRIAALAGVTKTRGPLEHLSTPRHLIDQEGFGPAHPEFIDGLRYAAKIAAEALGAQADRKKPRMIFIPSCAAYSDCWQPWLQFYRKHWKAGYYHRIVLATDFAVPERQQGFDHVLELEAMTGKHYPTPAWTTRLHDALKFTDSKQFILCCEDHWPLPPADWEAVEIARKIVAEGTADCVRLAPCPGAPESQIGPFGPVPDGTPYRISCGPTLWNTASLREFLAYLQHVLPLPTAHHYENFGSPASSRFGLNVWAVCPGETGSYSAMPFLNSAVTGGKWSQNALVLAKELGIQVDTSNREIAT